MTFIEQHHEITEEPDWDEKTSSDDLEEAALQPANSAAGDEPLSTFSLFDGDEGGLAVDERRTLVLLLKNRFITSESHPREWRTVVSSRQAIGQRLNDLFLELVISPEREVAFKRPVTGGREYPTLLHDTAWQREETALLVFLRVRSRGEQARGEAHARVSLSELVEYLRENRPDSATNRIADDRRAERAVGALKTAGLLVKTDEDGVFRISPAIEPMLPVTKLNDLLTWLTVRTAAGDDDGAADSSDVDVERTVQTVEESA